MSEYTDGITGEQFELPKLTLKLEEEYREAMKKQTQREKIAALLKWAKSILPDAYVAEKCGGKTVDNVDVVAVQMLADALWHTYQAPLIEARAEQNLKQLQDLQPTLEGIGTILKAMEKTQTRQGFKRVK